MDVSIIIVSYNTKKLTLECIESIYKQILNIDFEIIVVDNASSDGSADAIEKKYSKINLIRSKENLGFARANNMAAEQSTGAYLLLLNSDTVVLEGAVQKLFSFAEVREDAGIFGGSTFFADGSRNPSSCWSKPTLWSISCIALGLTSLFRKTKLFNPESFIWWDWSESREVDIISGCFLLIRKNIWDKLSGFSPDFFMYGEDSDLCLRAWNSGSKCVVFPNAKIVHYGGASDNVHSGKMIKLFTGKNLLLHKHNISKSVIPYLFDLWALSRIIAYSFFSLLNKSYKSKYVSWIEIYQSKSEWHFSQMKL